MDFNFIVISYQNNIVWNISKHEDFTKWEIILDDRPQVKISMETKNEMWPECKDLFCNLKLHKFAVKHLITFDSNLKSYGKI